MPGWSLLYELPWRKARKFAHDTYKGSNWGDGLNARSGLVTPSLPVLSTEVIVRTHVHGRAYAATGSANLGHAQRTLRDELLLASHALVGAVALGKTTAIVLTGPGAPLSLANNAAAVRHLSLPTLLRVGVLAARVAVVARLEGAAERALYTPNSFQD